MYIFQLYFLPALEEACNPNRNSVNRERDSALPRLETLLLPGGRAALLSSPIASRPGRRGTPQVLFPGMFC